MGEVELEIKDFGIVNDSFEHSLCHLYKLFVNF